MVSTLYHVAEVARVNHNYEIDIISINSFVKILNKTLLHVNLYMSCMDYIVYHINYKQVYASVNCVLFCIEYNGTIWVMRIMISVIGVSLSIDWDDSGKIWSFD